MSENLNLIPNSVLFNKKNLVRKGALCPLSGKNAPAIDYKDSELLSKFVAENGRILPVRITGVCAKKQRKLKKAIKRARVLALLAFKRTS